jgi:hypothetical protein
VKSGRLNDGRRASSSSPVGLLLAKPPRMGAWRGPIPRRRVTPVPVFGDFLACAKVNASGASEISRPVELHHMSSSSAGQESPAMIAVAAPCSSDRATVLRDRGRCWAAYSDGPMVRWAGLGHAIQAAKRGRVLTLPRSDASIANLAVINASTSPSLHHRRLSLHHCLLPCQARLSSVIDPLPLWWPTTGSVCRWPVLRQGRRRLQLLRGRLFRGHVRLSRL